MVKLGQANIPRSLIPGHFKCYVKPLCSTFIYSVTSLWLCLYLKHPNVLVHAQLVVNKEKGKS